MATPFRFSRNSNYSNSPYSSPSLKPQKPPIFNPYDKFTQPQFDAWINSITGALKQALGQETELAPQRSTDELHIAGSPSVQEDEHQLLSDVSVDEEVNDSFADIRARRATGKGKARDPREGPGFGSGERHQPIEIGTDSEEGSEVEDEDDEGNSGEDSDRSGVIGSDEEGEEEQEEGWAIGESSSQARIRHEGIRDPYDDEYHGYDVEDEEGEEDEEENGDGDENGGEVGVGGDEAGPGDDEGAEMPLELRVEEQYLDVGAQDLGSGEVVSLPSSSDQVYDNEIQLDEESGDVETLNVYQAFKPSTSYLTLTVDGEEDNRAPEDPETRYNPDVHEIYEVEDDELEASDAQAYRNERDGKDDRTSAPQFITTSPASLDRATGGQTEHEKYQTPLENNNLEDVNRADDCNSVSPLNFQSGPVDITFLHQVEPNEKPYDVPSSILDHQDLDDTQMDSSRRINPYHQGADDQDSIALANGDRLSNLADVGSKATASQVQASSPGAQEHIGEICFETENSVHVVSMEQTIHEGRVFLNSSHVQSLVETADHEDLSFGGLYDDMDVEPFEQDTVREEHNDPESVNWSYIHDISNSNQDHLLDGDHLAPFQIHDEGLEKQGELLVETRLLDDQQLSHKDTLATQVVASDGQGDSRGIFTTNQMPIERSSTPTLPRFEMPISSQTQPSSQAQLLDYQGEYNGFPAPPSERRHSVELPSVSDQDIAEILRDKLDPAPWISTDVFSTDLSEEDKHQGFEQPAVNETVDEEEGVMDINAGGQPRDLAGEVPLLDNVESHIQPVSDRHLEGLNDYVTSPVSPSLLEIDFTVSNATPLGDNDAAEGSVLQSTPPAEEILSRKSSTGSINSLFNDVQQDATQVKRGTHQTPPAPEDESPSPDENCTPVYASASVLDPTSQYHPTNRPLTLSHVEAPTTASPRQPSQPILNGLSTSHSELDISDIASPRGGQAPEMVEVVHVPDAKTLGSPPPPPLYPMQTLNTSPLAIENEAMMGEKSLEVHQLERSNVTDSGHVETASFAMPTPPSNLSHSLRVVMRKSTDPILFSDPYPYSLSTPGDIIDVTKDAQDDVSEEDTEQDNSMSSSSTFEKDVEDGAEKEPINILDGLANDEDTDVLEDMELRYPSEPTGDGKLETNEPPNTSMPTVNGPDNADNDTDADGDLDPDFAANNATHGPTLVKVDVEDPFTVIGTNGSTSGIVDVNPETSLEKHGMRVLIPDQKNRRSSIIPSGEGTVGPLSDGELPAILIIKKKPAPMQSIAKNDNENLPGESIEKPTHTTNPKLSLPTKRKRSASLHGTSPLTRSMSSKQPERGMLGSLSRPKNGDKRKSAHYSMGKSKKAGYDGHELSERSSERSWSSSGASSASRMLYPGSQSTSRASSIVSSAPSDRSSLVMQPSPTVNKTAQRPPAPPSLLHTHSHSRTLPHHHHLPLSAQSQSHQRHTRKMSSFSIQTDLSTVSDSSTTILSPLPLHKNPPIAGSPRTRSNCRYHKISIPREEDGPRITFLIPGCSLGDTELIEEENIEDHGDATHEDSLQIVRDIDSLDLDPYLIGVLRQLVGVDLLREQEVYYLPQPGEELFRKPQPSKADRTTLSRVPTAADLTGTLGSSHASISSMRSPTSSRAPLSAAGSASTTLSALRMKDSERESVSSLTESDLTDNDDDDELQLPKRARHSSVDDKHASGNMGPPGPLSKARRSKRLGNDAAAYKPEPVESPDEESDVQSYRKKGSRRGVKRPRTSEIPRADGTENRMKKQKTRMVND